MILPSYYLPPISWFSQLKAENTPRLVGEGLGVRLEVFENFQKQGLRNRCYIDSPNGKLSLSIPIDKSNFSDKGKCLMKDVRLSHQLNWRHQHWFSFETSYSGSPFFEYLQDDFHPIYEKDWKYLVDLNEALITKCLELLEIDMPITRTTEYQGLSVNEKVELVDFMGDKPYYQVYRHKHPFEPNLSIFDLLMNMGPEASLYL